MRQPHAAAFVPARRRSGRRPRIRPPGVADPPRGRPSAGARRTGLRGFPESDRIRPGSPSHRDL